MTEFKEFPVGTFVMRFYKTDHVWTCTVTEDMLDEVIKISKPLSEEYIESEWAKLEAAHEIGVKQDEKYEFIDWKKINERK